MPGAAQDGSEAQRLVHKEDTLPVTSGRQDDKPQETPLPNQQMLAIWISQVFQGMTIAMPYVLAVFMVRQFYAGVDNEQVIGQLTGVLAASGAFGRALSAFAWGVISDRFGRKIVIILGNASGIIGLVWFGASNSVWMAVLSRIIPSLFVGGPVAMKAMLGEACDPTSQARAMGILNLGWGSGTIIGPVVGGVLSLPCTNFNGFPLCEPGQIFRERPFILPCLAAGAFGVLALLNNMFLMAETHPRFVGSDRGYWTELARSCWRAPQEGVPAKQPAREVELREAPGPGKDAGSPSESEAAADSIDINLELGDGDERHNGKGEARRVRFDSASEVQLGGKFQQGQKGSSLEDVDLEQGNGAREEGEAGLEDERQGLLPDSSSSSGGEPSGQDAASPGPGLQPWHQNKAVKISLVGGGIIAFLYNFLDELTPIFVSAPPKQGGLGMPLEEFTWPIAFGGFLMVVFSLALYPRLQKRWGPLTMCRLGLAGGMPSALLVPLASLFTAVPLLEQATLFLAMGLKSIFKIMALNSSAIIINMLAPKAQLGAVSGASMTLQSGGRALGPFLSGTAWALTVMIRENGQQYVPFGLMAVSILASQQLYKLVELPQR